MRNISSVMSEDRDCWGTDMTTSHYLRITPACDLGKKRPKKKSIAKQIEICKQSSTAVRKRINPGFATEYSPDFLKAFRTICEIYSTSSFVFPEKQVLILMLENQIYPCRADQFSEKIVKYLADDIFSKTR